MKKSDLIAQLGEAKVALERAEGKNRRYEAQERDEMHRQIRNGLIPIELLGDIQIIQTSKDDRAQVTITNPVAVSKLTEVARTRRGMVDISKFWESARITEGSIFAPSVAAGYGVRLTDHGQVVSSLDAERVTSHHLVRS